jgi:putative endonuclease
VVTHNQRVGRWGEQAAADHLGGKGYEILERNVRTPYGEIDLVARKGDMTFLVEVKTRTSHSYGLPEEAITARKQAHLLACAEHYAAEHEIDHWQIDVIAVEKIGGKVEIVHFESIL